MNTRKWRQLKELAICLGLACVLGAIAWTWPVRRVRAVANAIDTTPVVASPAARMDVASCFKVLSLARSDETHYVQTSENRCGIELPAVYVLVKFFNSKGERIGVDYFGAGRVAAGERLRTILNTPVYVRGYAAIGVRGITANALETF